ncbi:MAG: cupredoxin domain-containing protein [Candidatus Shapirobacteria bacterium]|jgi:nitrite reductase (NO-forming)
MKNTTLFLVIIGFLILGGAVMTLGEVDRQSGIKQNIAPSISPQPTPEVKTFQIEAADFAFSTKQILAKRGDKIRIELVNRQGTHDFVLDEFEVETQELSAGQSDMVEFVANKTGTFEYYYSVGNHRAMGMVGSLVVTE